MTHGVVTAATDDTLRSVGELMRDRNVGSVVICDAERPVGVITDRDLALAVVADRVDPEELRRRMAELAEQMQGAQRVAWADNAIKLAVDMTVAGIQRLNLQGNAEQQSQELLGAMRMLFPEAVILVREAREGFGTT